MESEGRIVAFIRINDGIFENNPFIFLILFLKIDG